MIDGNTQFPPANSYPTPGNSLASNGEGLSYATPPVRPKHRWTDEMKEKLVKMRSDGATLAEVAAALGVTQMAAGGAWHRVIGGAAPPRIRAYEVAAPKPEPLRPPLPSPASTTALLCGDPLPGRSALDMKRGTFTGPTL